MQKITDKQLKEAYEKSPEKIRGMVDSGRVGLYAQMIGEIYDVSPEDSLIIEDAINSVLLGLMHPKNFISELRTLDQMDDTRTRAMAKDINRKIFTPVKPMLLSLYGIKASTSAKIPEKIPEPVSVEPIKELTSPKPTLVDPFKQDKKKGPPTPPKLEVIKKVMPEAPEPPLEYLKAETPAEHTLPKTSTTPENPFEALLKKKSLAQQGGGDAPTQATVTLESPTPINNPPLADAAPKLDTPTKTAPPKLHTTVAKAPKDPTPKESSHEKVSPPKVDPYRELPI